MAIKHPNSHLLEKIEDIEKVILELNNWEPGDSFSETFERIPMGKPMGEIKNKEECEVRMSVLKEHLELLREKIPSDNKLYLSEIVKKKNIKFNGNKILILSPVGSGKSSFIHEILEKDPGKLALHLVSNSALKESVCPEENEERKKKANNTFTTSNHNYYGDKKYKIHVMTYSEFGMRVKFTDSFINNIDYIFCDEAHSLPNYQSYNDSGELSAAIKTLFNSHEGKKIFYLTATDEHLNDLKRKEPKLFVDVVKYDFRENKDIKRYLPLSEYRFNHTEQIRPHLTARKEIFDYFNYKALAFSRTIESQKVLAKMAEEEGFTPLIIWSINNKEEEMTEEQKKCRKHILKKGEIPDPYNFLIINSAMQEGWDLIDKRVRLAIMNTTSETEKIQATGRLRSDVDILAYRVKKSEKADISLEIPENFLKEFLTKDKKIELCREVGLKNHNGLLISWPGLKKLIIESPNYNLEESTRRINKKATRVAIITPKSDCEDL